jgi:hypothetical protein
MGAWGGAVFALKRNPAFQREVGGFAESAYE